MQTETTHNAEPLTTLDTEPRRPRPLATDVHFAARVALSQDFDDVDAEQLEAIAWADGAVGGFAHIFEMPALAARAPEALASALYGVAAYSDASDDLKRCMTKALDCLDHMKDCDDLQQILDRAGLERFEKVQGRSRLTWRIVLALFGLHRESAPAWEAAFEIGSAIAGEGPEAFDVFLRCALGRLARDAVANVPGH